MFRRTLIAAIISSSAISLIAMAVAQDGFLFNGKRFASQRAFINQGCRCSTIHPAPDVAAAVEKLLQARKGKQAAAFLLEIPVQFIHITNGSQGQITESQRIDQINVLNTSYAPIGVQFVYDSQTYPPKFAENTSWYYMSPNSTAESQAKKALQEDPTKVLNFYTCGLTGGLLGWATFPWDLSTKPNLDGVVCLDESLPGGSASPYNLGDTATHEIGHWLGLYHTFQGGCILQNDHCDDTPAHASPNYGCPDPQQPNGACEDGQFAPIFNFMNYTDDACMDEFTPDQATRIEAILTQFRPGLLDETPPCDCPLDCIQASLPSQLRFDPQIFRLLREFRDVVLTQTEDGQELVDAYYTHSSEVYNILARHPQLTASSVRYVSAHLNNIQTDGLSSGRIRMTPAQFDAGLELLDQFSSHATPSLKETLSRVRDVLSARASVQQEEVIIDFTSSREPRALLGSTLQ